MRASDQLTFAAFPSMRQNHDDGSWEGVAQPFRLGQHCLKLRPIQTTRPRHHPPNPNGIPTQSPGLLGNELPRVSTHKEQFNRNAVAPSITSPPTPPISQPPHSC